MQELKGNGPPKVSHKTPLLPWAMAGFLLAYVLFFLFPVFLSGSVMLTPQVVPIMSPIGADLRESLSFVDAALQRGGTPYIGTATYPPLSYLLLAPLLLLDPTRRYLVVTLITVICYVAAVLLFPRHAAGEKRMTPSLVLVLATGLISYGLQFELERGQFNIIAVSLAYLAIWMYHSGKGRELWAYVLFSISVQLKLYPMAFILMFIRDWRDVRGNIRRLLLLAIANFGLFLALGWRVFLDFLNAVSTAIARTDVIRPVNHSIYSFAGLLQRSAAETQRAWPPAATIAWQVGLYVLVAACIGVIAVRAYRDQRIGLNPELLVACAVAMLVVPTVSYDYALAILAVPVASVLVDLERGVRTGSYNRIWGPAILALCFAYSSTLIPPSIKLGLLVFQDALPALLLILIADVSLALPKRADFKMPTGNRDLAAASSLG